jgi:hypothetical protein
VEPLLLPAPAIPLVEGEVPLPLEPVRPLAEPEELLLPVAPVPAVELGRLLEVSRSESWLVEP